MQNFQFKIAIGLFTASLVACGGGDDKEATPGPFVGNDPNPEFTCSQPIIGGTLSASFPESCTDCELQQADNITGQSPHQAGRLHVTLEPSETASVRVSAPDGVVYPVGSEPGVMFRFAGGEEWAFPLEPTWRIIIRTYLDGELVADEFMGTGSSFRSGQSEDDSKIYIYTNPLGSFDAVEFEFSSEAGTLIQNAEIYEVCSDLGR